MADKVVIEFEARLNDLEKDVKGLQKNLDKVDAEAKQASSSIGDMDKTGIKLGSTFKKLGGIIAGAFAIERIKQFTVEAIKLAAEAEGIQIAFNRLNDPNLLNDLRTAVNGTVSDIELMKQAVRASNFKIPMDQLAKLFEFATRRAKETGESVDYLVNSIVLGIGRKSPMILDNLGISAVKLKEELKGVGTESASIGDIAKAVGDIAEEEMQKMGENVTTAGDSFMQMNAAIQNAQLAFGQLALEGVGALIEAFDQLGILELTQDTEKLKERIKDITGVVIGAASAYATYKGILAVTNALQKANVTSTAAYNLALIATKDVMAAAAIAQQGLNKAIMANPYAFAAGAIATIVGAISSFVISSKSAEDQTDSFSDSLKDNIQDLKELKEVYEKLGISQDDVNNKLLNFEQMMKEMDLKERLEQQKDLIDNLRNQIKIEENISVSTGLITSRLEQLQLAEEGAKEELKLLIEEYNNLLKELGFGDEEIDKNTKELKEFGEALENTLKKVDEYAASLRRAADAGVELRTSVDETAASQRKGFDQAKSETDETMDMTIAAAEQRKEIREDEYQRRMELIRQQNEDAVMAFASLANSGAQLFEALGASGEKYAGFAKGLATFQVALSQGVAIANAVSQVKGLTGIDLIIQIAAITAQITSLFGQIRSSVGGATPPKFAKGGEIGGKLHSQGGTIIEAEKGEYVINRNAYAANKQAVEAINTNRFHDYIMKEAQKVAIAQGNGLAYDDTLLIHEVRKNKKVQVQNANELGRAFADQLARRKYFDA